MKVYKTNNNLIYFYFKARSFYLALQWKKSFPGERLVVVPPPPPPPLELKTVLYQMYYIFTLNAHT